MTRFNRNQRGFTLLEVLVAMLVLAFGVLGTVAYSVSMIRGNKEAQMRADAAAVSFQMFDRLVMGSISWAALGTSASCGQEGTSNRVCKTEWPANGKTFHVKWIICEDASSLSSAYTGDKCNIPDANLQSGPVPSEIACDPTIVNANEKEVKIMIHWAGPSGDCNTFHSSKMTLNPA